MDCIFCKIINKELPADIVYEDDKIIAFKDINPVAPIHILFVTKEHIDSANFLNEKHIDVVGEIFLRIKEVAKELNVADDGYRIVNNCGKHGGQIVDHIHFHFLAGGQLRSPIG